MVSFNEIKYNNRDAAISFSWTSLYRPLYGGGLRIPSIPAINSLNDKVIRLVIHLDLKGVDLLPKMREKMRVFVDEKQVGVCGSLTAGQNFRPGMRWRIAEVDTCPDATHRGLSANELVRQGGPDGHASLAEVLVLLTVYRSVFGRLPDIPRIICPNVVIAEEIKAPLILVNAEKNMIVITSIWRRVNQEGAVAFPVTRSY